MATATYKCPNCGGGLHFDPNTHRSTCEYCLSSFSDAELAALTQAIDQKAEKAAEKDPDSLHGYICDSCGAEVVTDETTSNLLLLLSQPGFVDQPPLGDFRLSHCALG